MTSTLKTDVIESKSTDGDLTIQGTGTGVPNLEAGFKVGGTAGVPVSALRAGTDGELITWNASGVAATVGVGSATNVLTSNGAGAAPTFQAAAGGGAWTLIGSQTASTSASLDITGISTAYDVYAFSCTNLTVSSAGTSVVLRCGDSGGFDSGASDYGYHNMKVTDASASYAAQTHAAQAHIHMALAINTTTGDHAVVNGYFAGGMDGVGMFYAHGSSVNDNTGADFHGGHWHGARNGVITVDRVQILMATGNIVTGRFTVWGLKHT